MGVNMMFWDQIGINIESLSESKNNSWSIVCNLGFGRFNEMWYTKVKCAIWQTTWIITAGIILLLKCFQLLWCFVKPFKVQERQWSKMCCCCLPVDIRRHDDTIRIYMSNDRELMMMIRRRKMRMHKRRNKKRRKEHLCWDVDLSRTDMPK